MQDFSSGKNLCQCEFSQKHAAMDLPELGLGLQFREEQPFPAEPQTHGDG